MIKIIVGMPGSGKTLSTVNKIINSNLKWFHNINGFKHPLCERLLWSHIIIEDKKESRVNWEFWDKVQEKGSVNIAIDECGEIFGARESMSKRNRNMIKWLGQIRKITGDMGQHNLYFILQRLKSLDIFARDLAGEIIDCNCIKTGLPQPTLCMYRGKLQMLNCQKHTIIQKHFLSDKRQTAEEKWNMEMWDGVRTHKYTSVIDDARPLFKHYDSYASVRFDKSEEYV